MQRSPFLRSALLGAALVLAGGQLAACDSTATIYTTSPKFQTMRILGAYPAAKRSNGSWERVCGAGPTDGFLVDVIALSSNKSADTNRSGDSDQSIRPGDVIDTKVVDGSLPGDISLSGTSSYKVDISCIGLPDPADNTCTRPAAMLDAVRYAANVPTRQKAAHNVMIVLDQSGSTKGLVDSSTFKEAQNPNLGGIGNFADNASDYSGLRFTAAQNLIKTLNATDRVGVLGFSEGTGVTVPCADARGDITQDLNACFGKRNTDMWLAGIESKLKPSGAGRSNLWLAVDAAYTYLHDTVGDTSRSNHIIVITDGPDTCQGEQRGACQSPCTTADYQALADRIETNATIEGSPKVNIHFVQFESKGYPGQDARQVELSCLSGGHYQFINSNMMSGLAQIAGFQDALDLAVFNLRYALMGHWEFGLNVTDYQSNQALGANGVPPGGLYGLEGLLTLKTTSNITLSDAVYEFGRAGRGPGADSAIKWDRRLTIRKPCADFGQCGGSSDGGDCGVVCSPETLTCAGGATALTLPDLASCGSGGFCCSGTCQTSGTCAACP